MQPLIETFNGSSWTFTELHLHTHGKGYALTAVTCLTRSYCIAVGGVAVSSEPGEFMHNVIETFNGTTWTPIFITSPGTYKDRSGGLTDVSCMGQGDCVAVGYYTTKLRLQGFAERLTKRGWKRSATPALTGSNSLSGVSCGASSCVAVGDQANQRRTLIERYASGRWSVVKGGIRGELESVSCPTPTDCAAAGEAGKGQPMVMTTTGGTWSAQPVTRPISRTRYFAGVSCASTAMCLAAGWGVNSPNGKPLGYLLAGDIHR